MEKFILLVVSVCFYLSAAAQKSEPKYTLLKGKTYTMNMFKDWIPPTGVTLSDQRLRKRKYEEWTFMRVNPKRRDRCGSTLTITEIKGCKSYYEKYREDSIRRASSDFYVKLVYQRLNKNNVRGIVSSAEKADRHPETHELSSLQCIEWYLQGEKNTYHISLCSCAMLLELLPEVEKLVFSLKEND